MFKFYIFSVIALAVAYQTLGTETSGKDEVKKAFHELMELIDKTLTEAQNALNKALDTVQEKAVELEDKAKVELDKLLAPLRTKLDDLVAKAEAKGFDVAQCQNYIDDFSATPDNMVHNIIDCVNQQISKAQGYVNDALNNAKQIEEDLNNIDSEIDNCKGNAWKQAKCYAKIIEEIAKDTKEAPQHIVEDVTKTTALISNLLPNLETCFVNQLKKAGEDAAEDVAKFAICAAV